MRTILLSISLLPAAMSGADRRVGSRRRVQAEGIQVQFRVVAARFFQSNRSGTCDVFGVVSRGSLSMKMVVTRSSRVRHDFGSGRQFFSASSSCLSATVTADVYGFGQIACDESAAGDRWCARRRQCATTFPALAVIVAAVEPVVSIDDVGAPAVLI